MRKSVLFFSDFLYQKKIMGNWEFLNLSPYFHWFLWCFSFPSPSQLFGKFPKEMIIFIAEVVAFVVHGPYPALAFDCFLFAPPI